MLEYYYNMLAEVETVLKLHDSVVALIISALALINIVELCQEFNLNICIVDIKFLILSDLGRYHSLVRIGTVDTADHLAKGAFIYDFLDEIPIAEVFANTSVVEAILVGDGVLIFAADTPDSIDSGVVADFDFFELSQLISKYF